jgi:hypothetical protein
MTTAMWGGVAAVIAWAASGVVPHPPGPGFEVIRAADGVVALVRSKAPGLMLDVGAFRARMTGGSPVLERLFDAWGPAPAVGALYRVRQSGER